MEIFILVTCICLVILFVALNDIKNASSAKSTKPSLDVDELRRLKDIKDFEFYRDIQKE